MKNPSVRRLAVSAVIAAVYAALTMSTGFMSYGSVQFRIAEALGIPMSKLFDENGQNAEYTFGSLNCGEEIQRNDNTQYGIRYLALAYRQIGRKMDPFVLEYTPATPREFMFHDTEEFFVLLEGEIEFYLYDDQNKRTMKAGDTLYMRANIPHRVTLCKGCKYAKAMSIYSDSMGTDLPR